MVIRIAQDEFEQLVEEALASIPSRFSNLLQNIVVIAEDEPSARDLDALDDPHGELLGIFRGIPRTRRTYDMTSMPDQIAIFRGPILRLARSRDDAVREIRNTVVHELGHYFGLDDDAMPY